VIYNNVSGHLEGAFDHFDEVIEVSVTELTRLHNEGTPDSEGKSITFDTLVCSGLSGLLIVPTLARELTVTLGKKVNLLIVRKSGNTHGIPVEGRLGNEWLFVDDFTGIGTTIERVYKAVRDVQTFSYGMSEEPTRGSDSLFRGMYRYTVAHADWRRHVSEGKDFYSYAHYVSSSSARERWLV
jgi:hypothetical protein